MLDFKDGIYIARRVGLTNGQPNTSEPVRWASLCSAQATELYHVTSRGDGLEDMYLIDDNREVWLQVLSHVCSLYIWVVRTSVRAIGAMCEYWAYKGTLSLVIPLLNDTTKDRVSYGNKGI